MKTYSIQLSEASKAALREIQLDDMDADAGMADALDGEEIPQTNVATQAPVQVAPTQANVVPVQQPTRSQSGSQYLTGRAAQRRLELQQKASLTPAQRRLIARRNNLGG